jgi:hypothetical protein
MPKSLTVTLANLIYFEKAQLPQALANRLIRLAAFQNPEFYKAQAMRMSVWDKPRVIGNAENYPQHIALPRGCLDAALDLLRDNGIACDLRDERFGGEPMDVSFVGTLRLDQEAAVAGMLHHDTGVLCAPTAFGKTVTAAAMIARRGVNTLVLVHRTELLKQWQERLQTFSGCRQRCGRHHRRRQGQTHRQDRHRRDAVRLPAGRGQPAGRELRTGDRGRVPPRWRCVVRCHPEADQGQVRAGPDRDADPPRWSAADHLHAVRADPVHGGQASRGTARSGGGATITLQRIDLPTDAGIQDVFRHLANDQARTEAIAAEVRDAYGRDARCSY